MLLSVSLHRYHDVVVFFFVGFFFYFRYANIDHLLCTAMFWLSREGWLNTAAMNLLLAQWSLTWFSKMDGKL